MLISTSTALLLTTALVAPAPSLLSRRHRAWVALYTLDLGQWVRDDVLRLNNVTEEDLAEFEASWLHLRCRNVDQAA